MPRRRRLRIINASIRALRARRDLEPAVRASKLVILETTKRLDLEVAAKRGKA